MGNICTECSKVEKQSPNDKTPSPVKAKKQMVGDYHNEYTPFDAMLKPYQNTNKA